MTTPSTMPLEAVSSLTRSTSASRRGLAVRGGNWGRITACEGYTGLNAQVNGYRPPRTLSPLPRGGCFAPGRVAFAPLGGPFQRLPPFKWPPRGALSVHPLADSFSLSRVAGSQAPPCVLWNEGHGGYTAVAMFRPSSALSRSLPTRPRSQCGRWVRAPGRPLRAGWRSPGRSRRATTRTEARHCGSAAVMALC